MISSTDILVINYYRGPAETGFYSLALRMLAIVFIVPAAATKIIHGQVVQFGPDRAWLYQRKLLGWLLGGMVACAIVAGALAPWIVPIIAGDEFAGAVPVFQLLLVTVVGVTLSAVMAPQWIGRGLLWQASTMTIMIGLGNLAASLLLVPRYGAYGAVFGTLITYTISIFVNGGMAIWCEIQARKVLSIPPSEEKLQVVR
jgi:O-antigen/teichoic acid export membrane protein